MSGTVGTRRHTDRSLRTSVQASKCWWLRLAVAGTLSLLLYAALLCMATAVNLPCQPIAAPPLSAMPAAQRQGYSVLRLHHEDGEEYDRLMAGAAVGAAARWGCSTPVAGVLASPTLHT